jgi:hypothetical protein
MNLLGDGVRLTLMDPWDPFWGALGQPTTVPPGGGLRVELLGPDLRYKEKSL